MVTNSSARRRGFVLVATLATMAVLISVLLPLVPISLAKRRQAREDLLRLQASFVLRAAVEKSLLQLDKDRAYSGGKFELNWASDDAPQNPPLQGSVEIKRADQSLDIQLLLSTRGSSRASSTNFRPQVTLSKSWELSKLLQEPK